MKKEELLNRAQELGIQVPEKATNAQISDLIKIAEHPLVLAELEYSNSKLVSMEKEISAKDEFINELEIKLADANGKIEELGATKNAADNSPKLPTYKTKDGEYEFSKNSFHFQGIKYSAEAAVENPELMEKLISSGFVKLKKS